MKKRDVDTTLDLPEEEVLKSLRQQSKDSPVVPKKSKGNVIKLNDVDLQLFVLLLNHKFLSPEILIRRFDPKHRPRKGGRSSLYYRLYRMVKEGHLHSIRKDGHQLFLLAERGLQAIREFNKSNLPIVSVTDLSFISHDLAAANLRFYFEEHGAVQWATERQFHKFASEKPKIPDGAFRWKGKVVFLEVEFSQKSVDRYQRIQAHYAREGGPDLVLYFFKSRSDLDCLIDLAKENPRFAFFPYVEKLPPPANVVGTSCLRETTLQKKLEGLR